MILEINQAADADGLIKITSATDGSETDFYRFYETDAISACIIFDASYNAGGNDSDAIKWDAYNF